MAKNAMTFSLFGKDVSLGKTLDKAGKDTDKFGKQSKRSFKGVGTALGGLGLAGAAVAVAGFAKKSADAYGSMALETGKLQRVAGGTAEEVSVLSAQMRASGLDAATTATIVGKYSKGLVKNEDAIKSLGVATRNSDGSVRSFGDQLPDLAAAFEKMPAGQHRTAMAMKLFGKQGLAMLPVLARGKDGLKDLGDQAKKAGTIIGEDDVAASKKAAGEKRKFNEAMLGIQMTLGRNLFPLLTSFTIFMGQRVVPVIATVVKWMTENKTVVGVLAAILVPLIAGLFLFTKVMAIVRGVTMAWWTAQNLLNLAFLSNPLTWVIVAIVALVAAIVIAYKRSQTFRNIVQAAMRGVVSAFNWVKGAAVAVFNWIKKNWPLLLAIITGPIGLAVLAIVKNWDTIKNGITTVKNWIRDRFNDVIRIIRGVGGRIKTAGAGMWDGLKAGMSAVINAVISNVNLLIKGINLAIRGMNLLKPGSDVPYIPELNRVALASGGIVTGPTNALIGEAGAEAVIPLTSAAGRRALGGGGGTTVQIFVNDVISTDDALARKVGTAVDRAIARGTYKPRFVG